MFKNIFKIVSLLTICLILLWGCTADRDNTFFDPTVESDLVQNGTFALTNEGLRERERLYSSQTFVSCGSRFEIPDFRTNLIVVIVDNQLSIDGITFQFVRDDNYYIGEYNETSFYLSFEDNILNMLLTNFGRYNRMNLQFVKTIV